MKALDLSSISTHQHIFTIIKPGFLQYTEQIIKMFEERGWTMDRLTYKRLTLQEAKELYKVHKDKDFYDDLCQYMCSGPTRAIIYIKDGHQCDQTYKEVSELKDEIRSKWGIDDCKNVMHSSDSTSAMCHEQGIYF